MDRLKSGRSARWGAACAPCAAAKTRCIRTRAAGIDQCDRCRSLEKDCVSQTPGQRKKRRAKLPATFSRGTAPPAEGLDNSTVDPKTLGLESSGIHGTPSDASQDYVPGSYSVSSVSTGRQPPATPSRGVSAPKTPAQDLAARAPPRQSCTCMEAAQVQDTAPMESDETLLSIYRNQQSTLLPFVIIPPGTTASQLETTRPFLMKVIRMVASVRHLRLVRGQSRAVMQHISNAILMRSERSLDLLQGILVFLGAYHYHCMAHAQFNTLIRLAVSLVEDMDWVAAPKHQQRRSQLPFVRTQEPVSTTNEQKRAFLGVWYMSSNAGLVVKQLAFTKYTAYLDQCLKDIADTEEYKTDQLLIQLVNIQRLTEKIVHLHNNDSPAYEQPTLPETQTMARLEAFRVELDSLRERLPVHLKSDCLFSCYYNSAYLRIFEPLLAGSNLPDVESQSFASLSHSGVSIAEVFSRFTAALKAWLESWLAIPVCSYFYMPQPAYVQLVHGGMMLTRWIRIAGPGAVKPSSTSMVVSQRTSTAPQPTPSLSGVPPCPDLSLPRPSASQSTHAASAQILDTLRANIAKQPDLQIDILGVFDTMAARFEAAKREMTAAQGLDWENNTWDFAAKHMKMKKARVEKWCGVVNSAAASGINPLTDSDVTIHEERQQAMSLVPGQNVDDFEWASSSYGWDNMQWESAIFDEILRDIHNGPAFKPLDYNSEILENM